MINAVTPPGINSVTPPWSLPLGLEEANAPPGQARVSFLAVARADQGGRERTQPDQRAREDPIRPSGRALSRALAVRRCAVCLRQPGATATRDTLQDTHKRPFDCMRATASKRPTAETTSPSRSYFFLRLFLRMVLMARARCEREEPTSVKN